MELHSQHDVIIALKRIKEERGISLSQIKKIVEGETGVCLSMTTIRRVFAPGSEDEHFNFESTIKPIADALKVSRDGETEDDLRTRCKLLEAIHVRDQETIEKLEAEIQQMKTAQKEKCSECAERQDRWDAQIKLKDTRIDRLHQHTEDQREMMRKMQAQFDRQQEQMDRMLSALLDGKKK